MEGFEERLDEDYGKRLRLVMYAPDLETKATLRHLPKVYPMPRVNSIITEFAEETIAVGNDDEGRNYMDVLVQSEFNPNVYHWINWNENPGNINLFPHLARANLENLDGPSDDYFKDGGPDLEDLGEAA